MTLRVVSRPRREAATTEARLLAIAADHLRRLGPTGVTVVGIADEAGMTHANVYRYYPSKAALIEAVAGQWLKRLEARLSAIADAPDPAADKLDRLILAQAAAYRELLAAERHLFDVVAGAVEGSRGMVRKHRARLRVLLERVLDEGAATGAFAPRDRDRAIGFVVDSTHRFVQPASVRLDGDVPRDVLDARLGAVLKAVQRVLALGVL